MYQSLYRTWRPRTFSEMVGQDNVVRTLKNQVSAGRIAHAYLFSGSRGTGKTSAARILAMAINCLFPRAGDPCLACEACQSLSRDTTLDVFEMDAASNSRVEEIRDMLERVGYPPQFVRSKVYIIDEVHMLSNAAFNALLKTLEEPPSYMVFILATTEPQKLPATILSRCQRFDFGRIREDAIIGRLTQALKPGQTAEEGAMRLIASAAEGSMRDAWSLMDMCLDAGGDLSEQRVRDALGTVDKDFMFSFIDALAGRDAPEAFRMISRMMQSGKDIQVFFKDISSHLRRLTAAKLDSASVRETSEENLRRIAGQAERIPLAKLVWMLERAVQAEGNLRWASQQRTILEIFALSLCELSGETEPLALQARIADLEKALEELPGDAAKAPIVSAKPQAVKSEPQPAKKPLPLEAPQPAPQTDPQAQPAEKSHKQVWNAMLERAKKELPSVYNMISDGRFGGYKDDCYYLYFPQDKLFLANFVMAPGRKESIEALLSGESGRPVRFEASGESTKPQELSDRQKAEEDIKALSDMFGRQNILVQGGEG